MRRLPRGERAYLIGVISDTHGLVRPEALRALKGSDLLIHAGDIGGAEVIPALRSIAVVVAVRGNSDRGRWASQLPETEALEVDGVRLYVLHDLKELNLDPGEAGFRVVISGHSHRPRLADQNGVLLVNPGSAGPRRFKLPVAVARLWIKKGSVDAELLELAV